MLLASPETSILQLAKQPEVRMRIAYVRRSAQLLLLLALAVSTSPVRMPAAAERHFLYVANPGTRNYVEYGGVWVPGFHIADSYKILPPIPPRDVPEGN